MKAFKKFIFMQLLMFTCAILIPNITLAQCPTQTVLGTTLVCNGDFESGDSCFSTNYNRHSSAPDVGCGTCFRDWSNPDEYEVTTNVSTQFHSGFPNIADHTPGPGNHMLAVDGSCTAGLSVWCQTVTVQAGTNYYFTSWVTSLHASNPAQLRYSINGVNVGATINAPATVGTWTTYTYVWNSGATSGAIPICIENLTTAGCGNGNDFALDDISFVAGCVFGSAGPQPNLGPDRSLCGTGGSITLNANVPMNATTTVTWNDGTTGTGMGAPYTKVVSTPGTYSVCVTDNGSCVKSDVVVITSGFTINLGPDVVLCNPTSAVLDAVYTNGTTSYVWRRNGTIISGATSRTYTATTPGTYRVEVFDSSCGVTAFDEVVITTQAATPNNGTYCPVASGGTGIANLSVTGSGNYEWYTASTGGAAIASGASYNPSGLVAPGPYTYWVEDISTFAYTVGPSNGTANVSPFPAGFGSGAASDRYLEFDVSVPITLVAVTVYAKIYNPNESITVSVTLRNSAGTMQWQVTRTVIGPPTVPAGNDWRFVIPVGQALPVGTNWRISNEGPSTGAIFWAQGGGNTVTWPYSVPGVISLKNIGPTGSWSWCSTTCYGFFYNWEIQAGVPCGRVPVTATMNCPLPVDFVSFNAIKTSNKSALLTWQTGSEKNSNLYHVERSYDGITFKVIGTVNAAGNSSVTSSYQFVDNNIPSSGRVYYRISEQDIDGSMYHSSIKYITIEDNILSIKPNPNKGNFNLNLSSPGDEVIEISILNNLGQEVYHHTVYGAGETIDENIDIHHLSAGVYILQVVGWENQWAKKIIKE